MTDFPERSGSNPSAAGVPTPLDRRTVTILFADVARSTQLIEGMDAELAVKTLGPLLNAMSLAVERYGGTITKRMGDGLMAVFGVPAIQEDHAVRASHAAIAIQQGVARVTQELDFHLRNRTKVRVGMNSGRVVATTTTEGGRVTYDTVGPTVHLASRMESVAEPGSIVVSEHTHRYIHEFFETRYLGPKLLKGFTEPQPTYELLRPFDHDTPKQAPGAHHIAANLVGREHEFAILQNRLQELDARQGSLVLVIGEPGIGKTRLLQEVRRSVEATVTWLEGHSLSFGQRLSYWPFVEVLRSLLQLDEHASREAGWAGLEQAIQALMSDEAADILPYLATLVGLEVPEYLADKVRFLDAERLGHQILRAVWRTFERAAQRQSLVVLIEDMHWIDGSSSALLEHLLPLANQASILFCVTCRPDGDAIQRLREFGQKNLADRYSEVVLGPLSVGDSQRLINDLVGDDPKTTRIRDLVLYKAEGNPFFAEEIIRTLIDAAVLVHDPTTGRWVARDKDVSLPDTIQGVIMARVDRLDERLKQVLCIASVIGRSFFYRVLRAVTEETDQLDDRLSRLKAIEIIDEMKTAPELAYLFRHTLAQEAIYESVLIDRRKYVHERVAECLEVLYVERLHEIASLLAFHYTRAENWPKALHFLLQAAEQSNRIAADNEALLLYEEAVGAYGRVFGDTWERDQRGLIERRLGEIHHRRGSHGQAIAHLKKALILYGQHIPETTTRLWLTILQGATIQVLHRLLPSRTVKEPSASADPFEEALLRMYESIVWAYEVTDQLMATAVIFRVINLGDRFGFAEGVSKASAGFGWGLDRLGYYRVSEFYHRRAIRIAEKYENLSAIGLAADLMGVHHFYTGSWFEADRLLRHSQEAAERAGDLICWSNASVFKAELYNETGNFAEALEIGEKMINFGKEAAIHPAVRWGLMSKGKALRRSGLIKEAEPLLREAATLSEHTSDFMNLGCAQGELSAALIQLGQYEAAQTISESCCRTLSEHRIKTHISFYPRAALGWAAIHTVEDGKLHRPAAIRSMRKITRQGYGVSRVYRNGLPIAMRLLGTAAWLENRNGAAERWWRRSLETAERFGAHYQSGLTLLERGRRTGSQSDYELGSAKLRALGVKQESINLPSLL